MLKWGARRSPRVPRRRGGFHRHRPSHHPVPMSPCGEAFEGHGTRGWHSLPLR